MDLKMELQLPDNTIEKAMRVKKAEKKKTIAKVEPSWEEVWSNIYSKKFTGTDLEKVNEVRKAIDQGEIGVGVESLKKFSKAHVLRLYKELHESRKVRYIQEMIDNTPDNYFLADNMLTFNTLIAGLEQETYIGLDTETTGVEYKDRVVGISITLPKADKHYYIPVRHKDVKQLPAKIVFEILKPFLEDAELGKILHNAKFDSHMLLKEGIDLHGITMDTMIGMHVLNENEARYALKMLATKYGRFFGFEEESHTYEELFGKGGFERVALDIGTYYACKDTHLVVAFYKWIDKYFQQQPQLGNAYYNIENPLLNVIIDMERTGTLIDLNFAKEYCKELETELQDLEISIKTLLGEGVEFGSSAQLRARLIEMGILDEKAKSVDKNVLKGLKDSHEVIAMILKHRGLSKLHGTYIEPLPKLIRETGRLHGQFNQHRTVTTRLSSDSPNLQNLPPKARKMFISSENKMFVGIDLSQIEPRYLSHIAQDKEFQHPYLTGIDLYSSLASKTFKVPLDECLDGSKYRKMMKVGLLAVMYGISDFELAKSLGITVEEAVIFMQDFMTHYPVTDTWIKSIYDLVEKQEYVDILGGYKRRFPEFSKVTAKYKAMNIAMEKRLGHKVDNIWTEKGLKYAEKRAYWDVSAEYFKVLRQSVNAVIQGSSATILKYAMIQIHDYLKYESDWNIVLSVHDEIILEIPDTATKVDIEKIVEIMCNVVQLEVPLKADCVLFKTWGGREIKLKDWEGQWTGEV